MLRDITIGQYYQTESVIHKLDPRVKIGGTLIYIISLFLFENVWGYLLAALFLGLVIKLSHVPFRFMVRGMKAILFLLVITFLGLYRICTPYFLTLKSALPRGDNAIAISLAYAFAIANVIYALSHHQTRYQRT